MSGDESRPRCIDDPSRPCHNDLGSHGPREIHDHPVSGNPIDVEAWSSRQGETMGAAFERAKAERDQLAAEVRRLSARSPILYPSDDALVAEVRRRGYVVECGP